MNKLIIIIMSRSVKSGHSSINRRNKEKEEQNIEIKHRIKEILSSVKD